MASDPATLDRPFVLGLTVLHGQARHDCIVELPPGVTVGALAGALASEIPGAPPFAALTIERTGVTPAAGEPLAAADIRTGDVVRLRAARPPAPPMNVTLRSRAAAGEPAVALRRPRADVPDAGGEIDATVAELAWEGGRARVDAGDYTVGSSPSSDVRIEALPLQACVVSVREGSVRVRRARDGPAVSVDGTVLDGDWSSAAPEARLRIATWDVTLRVADPSPATPGTGRVVIGDLETARTRVDLSAGGEIAFNRPPRRSQQWRPERIELPDPPRPPRGVRLPLVACLVPLVAGLAMLLIFRNVMFIAFMALSPLMAIGTYVTERRHGRLDQDRDTGRFDARLAAASAALAQALTRERAERCVQSPSLAELSRWPTGPAERLWERRPWDQDFLALTVGRGRLASLTEAVLPRPRPDETQDPRLAYIANAYRELDGVPYVLPLAEIAGVGVVGDRAMSAAAVRGAVLQTAMLHSPADLGIAAALPLGAEVGWEWLKWLPHVRTAAGLLGGPSLGAGRPGIEVLRRVLAWQQRVLEDRETLGFRRTASVGPALVLVVDEELRVERSLVSEILTNARELRTAVIWTGRDARGVPGGCGATVELAPDRTARVVEAASGAEHHGLAFETVDAALAERVARQLAPIRDATEANAAAAIPGRVRLLAQLGLPTPDAVELAERWQIPTRGLAAVIGAAADEPMQIDLRADGPHGLVAGTTGAGKSELLRTLVASLAAAHPPSRLTFLLIDYKGGAAFAPCRPLPHVLDVVSDLDAELGERALVSLDAEMKRRERILAETGADNLIDLERRARHLAPPTLVIMVDEFAKLRDEIPEFVDGVVDVAQRGRSLGIHMVLAAQSLRTAFTPAVRANTNLRIALRVTSDTESQDVLEAPDAARIPSGDAARGRAFARIGHERLLEFQTAHVSGRFVDPGGADIVVRPFAFGGVLAPSARRRDADGAPPDARETDLAALAAAARGATRLLQLAPPEPVWAPSLPEALPRARIQRYTDAAAGRCAIGLLDEPAHQRQSPLLVDFDRGHLAVFGGSGSGKTTVLRTLAAALAWDASPGVVQIYAVDAASGALSAIGVMPHVGAVIAVAEAERVERLVGRLEDELRRRSARFVAAGAATLSEYRLRASAGEIPPRIVVLIDGFGDFASAFDDARADSLFERTVALMSSGRAFGIHFVITADRRPAVRPNVAAHMAQRLVLRLATSDDLVAFGIPSRLAGKVRLGAGRGFTQDGVLAQVALPEPAANDDLAAGFRELGAHLAQAWPGLAAPPVGSLPSEIALIRLSQSASAPGRVAVGIGGPELGPAGIDLGDRHFLIAGPYGSGRSNALAVIAAQLSRDAGAPELHVLAPRPSRLLDGSGWASVARGAVECVELARALAGRADGLEEVSAPRLVVLVDDAGELQDPHSWAALERLVRFGRDRGVRVIAAAETSAARMLTNVWLREIRRDRHGFLLTPESPSDGDILGVALPRRERARMSPGRGYLVDRGAGRLVQLALAP